ncbi:MAG: hypothetical protein PVH00_13015 [Gemmatimonadota bacterium]|jgi:hypothetical protein
MMQVAFLSRVRFRARPPGVPIARGRFTRPFAAIALCALVAFPGTVAAQRIADVTNAAVRQAVAAYDAGELDRALQLLRSTPASLAAVDGSVRALYTGLIFIARSEPIQARESFMLAVRLDPRASLDPSLHAPSRIAAFEAARDAVIQEWRNEAADAAARGDRDTELRYLRTVLTALPGDVAAQSRIDAIEEEIRLEEAARQAALAAADSLRQAVAGQQDTTVARPAVLPDSGGSANGTARRLHTYSPGQALAMGIVPGLGQVYAGRRVLGVFSLALAGGAVATGVLVEHVKIDCRIQPVDGTCPAADVLGERTERPYLIAGIAGAAAVTLVGALDAFFAARRANSRAAEAQRGRGGGVAITVVPSVRVGARAVRVEWARIRF